MNFVIQKRQIPLSYLGFSHENFTVNGVMVTFLYQTGFIFTAQKQLLIFDITRKESFLRAADYCPLCPP